MIVDFLVCFLLISEEHFQSFPILDEISLGIFIKHVNFIRLGIFSFKKNFIYLGALGLSCGMRDL